MSRFREIKYRVARGLVAHAERVAALDHADWIEAIAHELVHLPPGEAVMSWALGCVLVSYTGRVRAMIRSPANWPRWLTVLEMLICLGPVTAYFVLICVSTVQGYTLFLPTQGLTQIQEGVIFGSAALIGPVGLMAAWSALFSRTQVLGRSWTVVLALLIAWALSACVALLGYFHLELAAWFGLYCLPFVLLPAVAVVHLAWLGLIDRRSLTVA
jgi:hypothetical protein